MAKTCLLGGNFALDIIIQREYPEGFIIGKNNKFKDNTIAECVGNTCGNVSCILPYLGVQTFPIGHFDLSTQGLKITSDLQHYGADTRFIQNTEKGGTTILTCKHIREKATGEHATRFRATSSNGLFPCRRFLREKDQAPALLKSLDFKPDVYFFDAPEAGLRLLAGKLRECGTLIYFEPESDNDQKKFIKSVIQSDIVKYSHEKVKDSTFTDQFTDKLFIRTLGENGLEFNLGGKGWQHISPVPNNHVVDWEGAGDWTTSQFIACLCERDILSINKMNEDNIRECLEIACATASRSISFMTSKGMIDMGCLPYCESNN